MLTPAAYKVASIFLICFGFIAGCSSQPDLVWNQEEGYRWAELKPGFFGSTGFKQHEERTTGISFSNDVSREKIAENRHYLNGSGVAVADVDGDGLQDIYFASLEGSNRLYKNLGNFRFDDITEQAGVTHKGYNSTGVVFADVNGNGYPDLLITSLDQKNALYINNGTGRFTLKEDSGLGNSRGAMTMTLADINRDGNLDLYITNYKLKTIRDHYSSEELSYDNTVEVIDGQPVIRSPFENDLTIVETGAGPYRNEIGEKDELYINSGEGVFEKADPMEYFFDEDGNPIGLRDDWGLTATFRDVNGDGVQDLYVANDFWTPDRFWLNQGDGRFRAFSPEAIPNLSFSSMGIDFSDINRDRYIDFVVTEMLSQEHSRRTRQFSDFLDDYNGQSLYNRNSVYLNRKDTTFAQIAYYSGLEASEWSWTTIFLDVDLDGYEDLIIATGYESDYQDLDSQLALYEQDMDALSSGREGAVLEYPSLDLPNKLFKNNGDLTFTDISNEWGFEENDISHGMALADFDNDGDLDLIFNRMDEEAALFENRSNANRIAVQLKGIAPNTSGIGAKVELEGGPVIQSKEITVGGNYLSGSQPLVVFAADENSNEHTITVTWPDGKKSTIENVSSNRIYEIDQASIKPSEPDINADNGDNYRPMFVDFSNQLNHFHEENTYDDFRFSPLLPLKFSNSGPGVAWIDIERDGKEELFITASKDGLPALFSFDSFGMDNSDSENIHSLEIDRLTSVAAGDQPSVLSWHEDGSTRITIGSANYEQGNPNVPSAFVYNVTDSGGQLAITTQVQEIPGILSTTGPIAAADYTGDGLVDLFIGGRHKPGQYPVNADSRLFRNNNGHFEFDETGSRLLKEVGLVTDALFADITGNNHQDLLISTEWGTLKLFENRGNRFVEITKEINLDKYKGWWNGIAIGDFTGNGLTDIVALNVGLNSAYQIRGEQPLRMYYDDFNWDRRLDILETYYSEEIGGYVPRRKLHEFESVPTILSNVGTHREYSRATIGKIFGQSFERVPFKEINTLEHMVFINTGSGFEAKPLPQEAQFSAGFSAGVADFNNDGHEDLFIGQNFFGFSKNIPRLDAGRGLLLKGDGAGNFEAVSGSESGIKIYGEQRGAAVGDFNQDGKTDFVVSQNNGQTKLFENQVDQEGIRVRLTGPPENSSAVGASIRLIYQSEMKGPKRFIQAGGSYGSQNSYTQILGVIEGEPPSAVEITWPGGRVETVELSEDQKQAEIEIGNIE